MRNLPLRFVQSLTPLGELLSSEKGNLPAVVGHHYHGKIRTRTQVTSRIRNGKIYWSFQAKVRGILSSRISAHQTHRAGPFFFYCKMHGKMSRACKKKKKSLTLKIPPLKCGRWNKKITFSSSAEFPLDNNKKKGGKKRVIQRVLTSSYN